MVQAYKWCSITHSRWLEGERCPVQFILAALLWCPMMGMIGCDDLQFEYHANDVWMSHWMILASRHCSIKMGCVGFQRLLGRYWKSCVPEWVWHWFSLHWHLSVVSMVSIWLSHKRILYFWLRCPVPSSNLISAMNSSGNLRQATLSQMDILQVYTIIYSTCLLNTF